MTCHYAANSARDASACTRTSSGLFFCSVGLVIKYAKSPLTPDQLLDQLESRGLEIEDRDYARHYLVHVGYYRLSGYTLLLETEGEFVVSPKGKASYQRTHTFREAATFSQLINLYDLDRRLRLHVLDAIERLEVAVRNNICNHMSLTYGDPHWYMEPAYFDNRFTISEDRPSRHEEFVEKVELETCKYKPGNRNAFCRHYYEFYSTPELPPSWMVAEQLSMSTWSIIYAHLAQRSDKKAIAEQLDVSPAELESWLRALTYLRNLCAHHARLLKINFVQLPKSSDKLPPPLNRFRFAVFAAVIHVLLRQVSPRSQWSSRTKDLLARFPDIDTSDLLGFPPKWQEDEFWA
jgi:abortive infection bacteriophage resistance protein